jgi:hypothetical protein
MKINIKKIGCEGVNSALDRLEWRALWYRQWIFLFHKRRRILLAERLSASEEGFCLIELDVRVTASVHFLACKFFRAKHQISLQTTWAPRESDYVVYRENHEVLWSCLPSCSHFVSTFTHILFVW